MKKPIIHEFDPLVYPRLLWVCINATKAGLMERFSLDERETDRSFELHGAATCVTRCLASERYGILVFCQNRKFLTTSNIAHESVHVADAIFEAIGGTGQDFQQGNEPYAYLVGWAADCIGKALKFKK